MARALSHALNTPYSNKMDVSFACRCSFRRGLNVSQILIEIDWYQQQLIKKKTTDLGKFIDLWCI